ncbi:exodeoxyribonuclease I [Pseudoalteromonas sp. OFAV1]|uniref:exodeoxyribonuclease I n=1 Tax=Pseudoalteromonas sp. OFAV1 TaxID=2908892 RepID=UPI001F30F6E5|nr:exodeoxyribonuclease I [Pseudoalteromonas sp. OFAV1]MCF2901876.1 exodeoxyribonuclease I [Pseudoalteromonas sp. OFAV1]
MTNLYTNPERYVFYDIESSSPYSKSTQILQIALIETDSELNILLDENNQPRETMFYVRMRPDMIPEPGAFLVHKIDPELIGSKKSNLNYVPDGPVLSELEANQKISQIMTRTPNTCIAGYNSIAFDDEVVRHSFYRNMLEPYRHEWANQNHRTDILKAVQIVRMYAENTLIWPIGNDGKPSLKLEMLSKENGLVHEKAHDALSDIYATIHLAKLIKDRKPQIWDKFKNLSDKRHVNRLLESEMLAVTQMFISKDKYSTSLVFPICNDTKNKSKYYALDLTGNISEILSMKNEDILDYMYSKKEDKLKKYPNLNFEIRTITANKLPIISSGIDESSVSFEKICMKIGSNPDIVRSNLNLIRERRNEFFLKVSELFKNEKEYEKDPAYTGLYNEFLDNQEQRTRSNFAIDLSKGADIDCFDFANKCIKNKEKNLTLMIVMKWGSYTGNFTDINKLSPTDSNELILYRNFVHDNLMGNGIGMSLESFKIEVKSLLDSRDLEHKDKVMLEKLRNEVDFMAERFSNLNRILSPQVRLEAETHRNANFYKYEDYNSLFTNKTEPDISQSCGVGL